MFFREKEFWLALIAVIVPILNHFFGFGMDTATLAAIILPIIALIFGFEWKEVQMARVEVQWAKLHMIEDDE